MNFFGVDLEVGSCVKVLLLLLAAAAAAMV